MSATKFNTHTETGKVIILYIETFVLLSINSAGGWNVTKNDYFDYRIKFEENQTLLEIQECSKEVFLTYFTLNLMDKFFGIN